MVFLCLCLPARPSRLERRTPPHALDHSPGHRGRPEPDRGRQWPDFAERQALAAGHSHIRLYTNPAMSENIACARAALTPRLIAPRSMGCAGPA
ncbi:hypothetical protein Pchl3084_3807 [Pseudomonas chlororaphis subsp. aureofaciens 30-84]|nr:hypothetical protein Pchl3084_3807 [Pseudomonas chlororaphis subsp. aureofaciens 30-84]